MNRRQFMALGLAVAFLALGLSSQAWAQGRGQGFRACLYAAYVCPLKASCKPFDEKGKVTRVLTETLAEGMYPGMALVLDTKGMGQVHVHLGPVWYLERQEFDLKAGDEVRVKGVCEKTADGRHRVVAYELTRGDHVLQLRDSQGRPHWEAWRKR